MRPHIYGRLHPHKLSHYNFKLKKCSHTRRPCEANIFCTTLYLRHNSVSRSLSAGRCVLCALTYPSRVVSASEAVLGWYRGVHELQRGSRGNFSTYPCQLNVRHIVKVGRCWGAAAVCVCVCGMCVSVRGSDVARADVMYAYMCAVLLMLMPPLSHMMSRI